MSRKHLFAIVVLLAAAAVAGLLALTGTGQVGAATTQPSSAQIQARTRSLDRLEASLRRSLAKQPPAVPAGQAGRSAPTTVLVRRALPPSETAEHEDDHGDDEHGEADD